MIIKSESVDYPFLITIAGIGGLVSLAMIIFGFALGMETQGNFLAALSLMITAFFVGQKLYGGQATVQQPPLEKSHHKEAEKSHEEDVSDLQQLGRIFDSSNSGLVVLSAGQITYANEIFQHWAGGASEKEWPLPCAFSDFSKADSDHLNGQIPLRTLSGKDITLDFLAINGDFASRMNLGDQDVTLYQVTTCQPEIAANDTDRKNINTDRFFRESPIGIAIVSAQGDILELNHIFRNYIRELAGKNDQNLKYIIDPDDHQEFYNLIAATLESGQAASSGDVEFRGEGEKHGHLYITRLSEYKGHDRVAILYLIDTTEQKNLELQFAQSQKMQAVGQLAGGIAHDFNNLLTAIIGFSDLLLIRHGPGDQSFSDISQIKQNAARAANLVRQLLAFSRQQTLQPEILSMTDVLAELSNLLRRLIGDNIELEIRHGRGLGQIKADLGQMEQVIINLCVNARDAIYDREDDKGDNQGKISIRTRNISLEESIKLNKRYQVMPQGKYMLLEVEDTGCGIETAHLGKIFEPFFSTKEVGKGTGLGLSTVYGIVKQTDGFIFPASEVGKGTIFSIYLPAYEDSFKEKPVETSKKGDAVKPAQDLTGKATILLVEDEDAVRMFASRALKNKGYKVYEASSGQEAITLFEDIEGELDLLISDVVMPVMDGPTLVRKIRKKNKRLKVIFISGYAEDAFNKSPGDKSLSESDFHFLPKPFSLKQLAEQVKEVLEEK